MGLEEKKLRKWLRENLKAHGHADKLFWIEHGPGGTEGLPDCFIITGSKICFFELKRDFDEKLNNNQKDVAGRLIRHEIEVFKLSWGATKGTVYLKPLWWNLNLRSIDISDDFYKNLEEMRNDMYFHKMYKL